MTDRTSLDVTNARLDAATNREQVVEAIREIIINLIGSEEFAIFTLDRVSRQLSLLDSEGIATWRYRTIPVDAGVIGRVAATGEPYIASDGDHEPDAPDLTACFPLKLGDAVTGAIAIFRLLPQKPGLEVTDCELLDSLGTKPQRRFTAPQPDRRPGEQADAPLHSEPSERSRRGRGVREDREPRRS